jgi:hypothetical protein
MSPNFPDQYPDSVTCTYLIKSPLNLPMALTFTAFEVETAGSSGCYDFVRVSTLRSYGVLLSLQVKWSFLLVAEFLFGQIFSLRFFCSKLYKGIT